MENNYSKMMEAEGFLPYRVGYLTDWMVKKAEEELNETEENRVTGLAELRRLIANEKALKDVWTDDAYLLQFLRARKFNPKKAWDLFHTFYTVKKDFPEVYPVNFDFEKVRNMGRTNGAGAFNYRNKKDGSVVILLKVQCWDPEIFSIQTVLMGITAMFLAAVDDPATQVCGAHILVDTADFSWKQLRTLTPRYIKLLAKGIRSAFPVRVKGIHIVNAPLIFNYFINILKMFLTEKIKKRIHFHGSDMENLHKYISKEILPPEFGGPNTDFSGKEWCRTHLELFIDTIQELLYRGYS